MFGFLRRGPVVNAPDVVARVGRGEMLLVDVREPSEFRGAHAVGAENIPAGQVAQKLRPGSAGCPAPNTATPVALYCASGARSGAAARQLRQMGYTEVVNLGGLRDWQRGGGAVTG